MSLRAAPLLNCTTRGWPGLGFASPVQPVYKGSSVFMPSVAALKATAWKDRDAYTYGLHGTPTTFALESRIAALEGATHALLAPSGLAALNLVSHTLLRSGDQVCIPDNVYGPSRASCRHELAGWGVSHAVYDPLDAESLRAVLTPQTRLIWLEAAGSVTLEFPDLLGLMRVARVAAPQAVVALDNTWGCGIAFDAFALPGGHGGRPERPRATARSSNDWRPRTAAAAWAWAPTMWNWCCATCRPCRCATRRRTRLRAASPSGRAICRA